MSNTIKLISLEIMHKIFKASAMSLVNNLPKLLNKHYKKEDIIIHKDDAKSYVYVKGDAPYLLVAHLDTVHHSLCEKIIYDFYKDKSTGKIMTSLSSPQGIGGDDRCGVILILSLLNVLPVKPSVLFTCGEETGGHGARAFVKTISDINANFILEFDRKGNEDVVRYFDDNLDLTKALECFGFKTSYGSFSDISIIAPHYGISAVNLSSGYYKAHTTSEYVVLEDMETILNKAYAFLTSDKINTKYIYKERVYTYPSTKAKFIQGSLFDKAYNYQKDYRECDSCSQSIIIDNLIETSDGSLVCSSCAELLKSNLGYKECPFCGVLLHPEDLKGNFCDYCGGVFDTANSDDTNNF